MRLSVSGSSSIYACAASVHVRWTAPGLALITGGEGEGVGSRCFPPSVSVGRGEVFYPDESGKREM